MISSQPRYDHFDTSPYLVCLKSSLDIISYFNAKIKRIYKICIVFFEILIYNIKVGFCNYHT